MGRIAVVFVALVWSMGWLAASAARAEDLGGRVYRDFLDDKEFVPGVDVLTPNAMVRITRVNAPPGQEYENLALTDAQGRYRFTGLAPGSYSLSLPSYAPPQFRSAMVRTQPPPNVVLPGVLDVAPGTASAVDMPWIPQDGGETWAIPFRPDDIVVGQILEVTSPAGAASEDTVAPVYEERALHVTLTFLDRPGQPTAMAHQALWDADFDPSWGFVFEDDPVADPAERVRVSLDAAQVAALGLVPIDPLEVETTRDERGGYIEVVFRLRRAGSLSGRVYLDLGTADGQFGGTDRPLGGVTVALHELSAPPPAPPLRTATTDAAGQYGFDLVPYGGYSIVASDPISGATRHLGRMVSDAPSLPADFAFARACPSTPCTSGSLHEILLEGEVWVGDQANPPLVAQVFAPFPLPRGPLDEVRIPGVAGEAGPWAGANEVLTVLSAQVVDGVLLVRLRLTATGPLFPCGQFGGPLLLSLRSGWCGSAALLLPRCESLRPGDRLHRVTVLDTLTVADWTACHPDAQPEACRQPPAPPRGPKPKKKPRP